MAKSNRKKQAQAQRKERIRRAIIKIETLREVVTKSYQVVRMRRIHYKDFDEAFIDLRVFSRGFDKDEKEVYHPTRQGMQMLESVFSSLIESHFFAELDRQIGDDPR